MVEIQQTAGKFVEAERLAEDLAGAGVVGVTIAWIDNNGIPRSRTAPVSRASPLGTARLTHLVAACALTVVIRQLSVYLDSFSSIAGTECSLLLP